MNYVKRKQQLDHILKDKDYWKSSDGGFKSFLADMHNKVSKGNSLSEKQENAINNAISNYAKYFFKKNDPNYKTKKETTVQKVRMVQKLLYECNYERSYECGAEDFLNSVETQVKIRGSLSEKQKKVLNKMYKRFKKRIEK
jgi:hypothetical protein